MSRSADQRILTLNSGSSSLRFARYHMGAAEQLEARGYIDRIGVGDGRFRLSNAEGEVLINQQVSVPDHRAALEVLLEWLQGSEGVSAVGHRVVHGGAEYRDPQPVTPELLATLKKLVPLAPEHLPYQIAAMETIGERYPSAQQIACFDTAFHRGMPEVAQVYALPQDPRWEGVIRYGFHGLSCEYIMSELRAEAGDGVAEGRVIIAHLGNGASMTAVRGGRSVDTTMGLTPTGGLVMSTRSGDLDPSVVLYLIAVGGLSVAEAHRLLNHQSGLLGLSGRTSDMKDLQEQEAHDPRAALAVNVFCYQARKFLAALAAGLGGLDDVVFTGGIGENAAPIRWRICESMEFLGLRLDPARNEAGASIISHPESRVTVRVMKTNEELMIARHVNRLVRVGRSEPMKRTVSRTETPKGPLSKEELRKLDAYWRASLYLCVGMIYLRENPLLREPLKIEQIKKRLLGHWGSTPGQSFIWVHLNRLIKRDDLNMIYISGPGHGAPAVLANAYLEGTYSQVYPEMSEDEEGMQKFFKQFSFPGGIGSHCTPETPGSMHEGGELGYSLSHAFGAAFDNPDLIVAAVVGDGEAETGPLATSWHSNKFLNPIRDGAVLPILHLNGYKIANPTILARIPHEQLESLFVGYGYKPYFVEGSDPEAMHQLMAETLERCVAEIKEIQQKARSTGEAELPQWPMIVLRTPKGWTGPKEVDGHKVEGYWRSHQVPFQIHDNPSHLALLEEWMRSYRPEELFDGEGRLIEELRELPPTGQRRMSANRVTNGGIIPQALRLPDFRDYAVEVPEPGTTMAGGPGILGQFLRDTMRENPDRFRVFGPDETASNRLTAIYEVSKKTWLEETLPEDADGGELAPDGRVMEMLSEHTLEGWLEGYTLSGRHGFFASYEAFMHVVDSMFNQHAKWLAKCREIPWRAPVPSLNLLVTSTVWRQDHNGFSHQDPGFLDVVTTKSPDVTRIYLPPDANCLLSVGDHCLHSMNYVNVIVSDKYPHLQYLTMDEAIQHCTKGLGIWDWASTDEGSEPEVVLGCAGDIPTTEALAAAAMLRENFPDLKLRFVNIVDLFKLQPESEHPHGMSDRDFDSVFTIDKPIIMGFHGYPWLIHKLAYRRTNHSNLHVRGYKEQGNINTPLELAMLNHTDRFSLAIDVIDRVPRLRVAGAHVKEWLKNQIIENTNYAHDKGEDKPEMTNWVWPGKAPAKGRIGLRKAA